MSDTQQPEAGGPSQPAATCACSAAADLTALKAKTANWKKIVKGQLDEAQAKNQALREESAKLNDKLQSIQTDTRLQLTAEFKDRLAIKDDEMGHYKAEYEKLKQDMLKQTKHHTEQLGLARTQAKAEYEALQLETSTIQGNLRKEMELEGKLRDGMKRRLGELDEQNRTLVEQLQEISEKSKSQPPPSEGEGSNSAGDDEKVASAIATANAAAAAANPELEAMVAYLQDREQQLVATVAQKEEQCLTLHATIRTLRSETQELQLQVAGHGETLSQVEEKNSQRLSKLTTELLHKHEELSTQVNRGELLGSEVATLHARLEELRAEATVREAAFDQWFQSEQGEKGNLVRLEHDLKASQQENERLQASNEALENEVQDLHLESDELKKEMSNKSQDLATAEKNLALKMERLRVQEDRVRQKQQELSDQASHILGRIGGGSADGEAQQAGGKHGGSSSSSAAGGTGGSSSGSLLSDYSFISALQDQYRQVLSTHRTGAGGTQLFTKYKRWLPAMIICLFLMMIMFWMREGSHTNMHSAGSTLGKLTDADAALAALRREYDALLVRCGPPSPPGAKN